MKTSNSCAFGALSVMFAAISMTAVAKTTTFNQTAYSATTFDFSAAENWDNGAPEPGDTVVINVSGTAWNKWETFTGSFDVGTAGLTLSILSGNIRFNVAFSGTGKITKSGGGVLGVGVSSTFSGGTDHLSGKLEPFANGISFGTGSIDVYATESSKPIFGTDGWCHCFRNDINVHGTLANTYTILSSGQMWTLAGGFSTETDLTFKFNGTGGTGLYVTNAVTAAGHTLTLGTDNTTRDPSNAPNYEFSPTATVNASLELTSCYKLKFNGKGIGRDNKLTIAAGGGDCLFGSGARWAGTNVVMASSTSTLSVVDATTFPPDVSFDVVAGAKFNLANNCLMTAKSVKVGGVELPEGSYSAANRPDLIIGGGAIVIVRRSKLYTWKGGVTGGWNVATNWDPAEVPLNDAYAVFTNHVTFAAAASPETVTLGSAGIALVVLNYAENDNMVSYLEFTGSGPLDLVLFRHQWRQQKSIPQYSGDIRIRGTSYLYTSDAGGTNPFGTGSISVCGGINSNSPQFYPDKWGAVIPNDIYVYGSITNLTGLDRGRAGSVTTGGALTLTGNIVADSDLLLSTGYAHLRILGSVTVPDGKEIRLYNLNTSSRDAYQDGLLTCEGELHGKVVAVAQATRPFRIGARMTDATSSLTSLANTNLIFMTGASWAGTNVTVRGGAKAKLVLNGADSLKPYTVLSLGDGATADLNYSGKMAVAELWIDGVKMPDGRYNTARLPARFSGTGALKVGNTGIVIIFR